MLPVRAACGQSVDNERFFRRSDGGRRGAESRPASKPSASPTTSITARPRSPPRLRGSTRSASRMPARAPTAGSPAQPVIHRIAPACGSAFCSAARFIGRPITRRATNSAGIAVIRGHTAYQVPMHGGRPPANRPGLPPQIVTWADKQYLRWFADDIAALRAHADIVVASCHWGVGREVLHYMSEIGHAAIDAGADIVIGHGPHYALPVEIYRAQADLLRARQLLVSHRAWRAAPRRLARHDGARPVRPARGSTECRSSSSATTNRTGRCCAAPADEAAAFDLIGRESASLGAELAAEGDQVAIKLPA